MDCEDLILEGRFTKQRKSFSRITWHTTERGKHHQGLLVCLWLYAQSKGIALAKLYNTRNTVLRKTVFWDTDSEFEFAFRNIQHSIKKKKTLAVLD